MQKKILFLVPKMKSWILTFIFIKSYFSQTMKFYYPTEQKTVRVPMGKYFQIDSLENQGSTIKYQLKFHGEPFYDHPCRGDPSRIRFSQHQELEVVQEYSEDRFSQILLDGHFDEVIESIIGMVHVDNGVVLLTNKPSIVLLKIKDQSNSVYGYQVVNSYTITNKDIIQNCSTSIDRNYIQYHQQSRTVYILSCDNILYFQVNANSLEFQNDTSFIFGLQSFNLNDLNKSNTVTLFQISSNYAYIGFKNSHLGIYKISDSNFTEVARLNQSVIDLKIVLQEDNITENLYVLDEENGVYFYQINDLPQIKLRNISQIQLFSGIALDLYGKTLIVLNQEKDIYLANDFHIEEDSWYKLNTWVIDSPIRDVEVTKDFAIILGDSGHYILYHSINHNYFQYMYSGLNYEQQPFFFRGARQIDFFTDDLLAQEKQIPDHHNQIIFGVSNHRFMIAKWTFKPFQIHCYSTNQKHVKASPLQLDLNITSTQCIEKVDKENDFEACISTIQYKIQFYHALLNTKQNLWIVIVVSTVFIILGLLGFVLLSKYVALKRIRANQQVPQNEKQLGIDMPDLKYLQVSGRSPQYDDEKGSQIQSPSGKNYQ